MPSTACTCEPGYRPFATLRMVSAAGVASKSRIHDVFSSDRLPTWGLVQLLTEVMVQTIPGSDLEVEEGHLYNLWLAASGNAAATNPPGLAEQPLYVPSSSAPLEAQGKPDTPPTSISREGTRSALPRLKYAALSYTIDRIELDLAASIRERGFYLSAGLEADPLAVTPRSSLPGPSIEEITCQAPEKVRRLRSAQHLGNLRADLLTLGMDFADGFKDVVDKIMQGETVHIVARRS